MEELLKVRKNYARGLFGNTTEESDRTYFSKLADMLNMGKVAKEDLTLIEQAGIANLLAE